MAGDGGGAPPHGHAGGLYRIMGAPGPGRGLRFDDVLVRLRQALHIHAFGLVCTRGRSQLGLRQEGGLCGVCLQAFPLSARDLDRHGSRRVGFFYFRSTGFRFNSCELGVF